MSETEQPKKTPAEIEADRRDCALANLQHRLNQRFLPPVLRCTLCSRDLPVGSNCWLGALPGMSLPEVFCTELPCTLNYEQGASAKVAWGSYRKIEASGLVPLVRSETVKETVSESH